MQEVATAPFHPAITEARRLIHPIVKTYWIVWIVALGLAVLLPVTADSGSWFASGSLSVGYVLWTSIIAIKFGARVKQINSVDTEPLLTSSQISVLRRMIVAATFIGLLGFYFMYYDRVYYQGVDYTESLAGARSQMRMAAELRQGFSSVYSVLGNFLWAFSYIPLGLVVVRWEMLKVRIAWLCLIANVFVVWGISALNGGRSPILLGLGMAISAICVRKSFGLRAIPKLSKHAKIYAGICGVLISLYSPYILIERARAVNVEYRFYVLDGINYLHGRTTDAFIVIDRIADAVGSSVYVFVMNLCHLCHQFWVFEDVIFKDDRRGSIIFGQVIYYMQKLSFFNNISTEWDYSGLFLPLPGAIFYDFGVPGLVLIGFLHGVALGRCSKALSSGSPSSRQMGLIFMVFTITFLSPFVAIFLLGPFTFMFFGFFILLMLRRVAV